MLWVEDKGKLLVTEISSEKCQDIMLLLKLDWEEEDCWW